MQHNDVKWEDLMNEYFPRTYYNYDILEKDVWNCQSLLGFLYSTSFCSRELPGEKAADFERELRQYLLAIEPGDRFEESVPVSILLGWK